MASAEVLGGISFCGGNLVMAEVVTEEVEWQQLKLLLLSVGGN